MSADLALPNLDMPLMLEDETADVADVSVDEAIAESDVIDTIGGGNPKVMHANFHLHEFKTRN